MRGKPTDAVTRWREFEAGHYLERVRASLSNRSLDATAQMAAELSVLAERLNDLEINVVTGEAVNVPPAVSTDIAFFVGATSWLGDLSDGFSHAIGTMEMLQLLIARSRSVVARFRADHQRFGAQGFRMPGGSLASRTDEDVSEKLTALLEEDLTGGNDPLYQSAELSAGQVEQQYAESAQRFAAAYARLSRTAQRFLPLTGAGFCQTYEQLVAAAHPRFRQLEAWEQQALIDVRHVPDLQVTSWNRLWVTVCIATREHLREDGSDQQNGALVLAVQQAVADVVSETLAYKKKKRGRFDATWFDRLFDALDSLVSVARSRMGRREPVPALFQALEGCDAIWKQAGREPKPRAAPSPEGDAKQPRPAEAPKEAAAPAKPLAELAAIVVADQRKAIRRTGRRLYAGVTAFFLASCLTVLGVHFGAPRLRTKPVPTGALEHTESAYSYKTARGLSVMLDLAADFDGLDGAPQKKTLVDAAQAISKQLGAREVLFRRNAVIVAAWRDGKWDRRR